MKFAKKKKAKGRLLEFPPDMFALRPEEVGMYGAFPDLKKCVDWFKGLITEQEWVDRRKAVAKWFYQSLVGELVDPNGLGRFFNDRDQFAWYLFLGEAFTDHPWNYEVVYGCRVIPIFAAIGRNLDMLVKIPGFTERAKRLLGPEKGQPNGVLFEMLVAAAYARAGAEVEFVDEAPGQRRTHDLNVCLDGNKWAVECKRMEGGQYVEKERQLMRELWLPASFKLVQAERNAILNINFKIELENVAPGYLQEKVGIFLRSRRGSFSWGDEIAEGIFSELDLRDLQEALQSGHVMFPSPLHEQLLTGTYQRYRSALVAQKMKPAANPHFLDEVSLAVAARWKVSFDGAIEKRARDIFSKVVEADKQLPSGVPSIIHVGLDALGDDEVEQRRYEKIISRTRDFVSEKKLRYIYVHYFAPEATPTEAWAFDETVQWLGVDSKGRPLQFGMLVMPDESGGRSGVHWGPPSGELST